MTSILSAVQPMSSVGHVAWPSGLNPHEHAVLRLCKPNLISVELRKSVRLASPAVRRMGHDSGLGLNEVDQRKEVKFTGSGIVLGRSGSGQSLCMRGSDREGIFDPEFNLLLNHHSIAKLM